MPIYEYQCPVCGRTYEALLPVADRDNLSRVPRCAHGESTPTPTERRVSAPAFHLQGGGWYKDGYSGGGK